MDKIALYEALLEEHPLWNKEATLVRVSTSKAHRNIANMVGRMAKVTPNLQRRKGFVSGLGDRAALERARKRVRFLRE